MVTCWSFKTTCKLMGEEDKALKWTHEKPRSLLVLHTYSVRFAKAADGFLHTFSPSPSNSVPLKLVPGAFDVYLSTACTLKASAEGHIRANNSVPGISHSGSVHGRFEDVHATRGSGLGGWVFSTFSMGHVQRVHGLELAGVQLPGDGARQAGLEVKHWLAGGPGLWQVQGAREVEGSG